MEISLKKLRPLIPPIPEQTRNYKTIDNFSDEISLDQSPNCNTFQLNSKGESEELCFKFEELISQSTANINQNFILELLEKIEFHLAFAENEVQFEEKLQIVLSTVLEKLASSHEIVQRKAISILNHINKRMSKTVKLPWDSLVELVFSVNFMNSAFVKNFTIMYLKKAYDSLTEKDKITHLLPLTKNIELKPRNQKKFLYKIILEFLQKLRLKFADLETKEVVDGLYSLYECSQQELLFQSQSLKAKIMDYLCKSKLAANTFPAMLHVSFDCLYSPKTDENLQKQGVRFIQWITRMVDSSRLKLIGNALLFGLLKIIKETGIENIDNLTREQEIKTLQFKPFYGPLDLSIHSPEEDNENLKVITIKFQEFNQLNQLDQWINEANIQEMEKILEENTNKVRIFVKIF
ncbi:23295_t:CDS:10 [Gigaspora margarita]|uniref:23295_t:CDS:1 n=1 Tax=Gigaspora margarita TaxID=4874 RepID=A0ABM8W078_GIGMA|nr:23295_t:CDS:10 [Gigaspora margarita]